MSTRELAIQLGLIERFTVDDEGCNRHDKQEFQYLFVLDFEATCWDKHEQKSPAEVIEFAVVFYSVQQKRILSEFQQYVMPIEEPILSDFCVNFTGITQEQVNKGVPIQTCLMLFKNWVKDLTSQHNLTFLEIAVQPGMKKATFVTWSDWDLNTCLKKECRRKCIQKPDMFNKWTDLRKLYKDFYNRTPKGLNGAISEVGLTFKGKQHCGLDDARNTAYLARKMISVGLLLYITKRI